MLDYDRNDEDGKNADIKSKPIANLFPETTVMFADMEGFTAWASMRDPIAVFHLLETIYGYVFKTWLVLNLALSHSDVFALPVHR